MAFYKLQSLFLRPWREDEHPAVEVAAHEVAEHLGDVDDEHLRLQQLC